MAGGRNALELRPYQEAAAEAFIAAVRQGRRRTIVQLPTGTGKTIMGLSLARRLGRRTLWIAHRDELLRQPLKALGVAWPGASAGVVKAERNDVWARNVVFASIQTICNPARLEQLGDFGLVVVDEAHHAPAASYRRVLEALGCFRTNGPPLLGLTATVERTDQAALDNVFQGLAYQLHLKTAIEQGYLVPVRAVQRPLNLDLDSVQYRAGDWATSELDAALLEAGIVREVASAVEEHARSRKSIVFTISVAQAHAIAEELARRGYAAEALDGTMPVALRQGKLGRLARGETQIVVNCAVLTEGFDEPSVDCVVMARPTGSKTLYLQCVGRGLRLYPGKDECLVVDLVGVSRRHTLMQAPVLFGVEQRECGQCHKVKPVSAFNEDASVCRACAGQSTSEGVPYDYAARLQSQVKGLPGVRSSLTWLRPRMGVFALDAGPGGRVVLEEAVAEPGAYAVYVLGRAAASDRELLTEHPVTLELAQGLAEDYVRRVGAVGLVRKTAAWRSNPPSPKQLAVLRRAKVRVVPRTAGEASDLIAAHFAQRDTEPATEKQLWYLRSKGLVADGVALTKREAGRLIASSRGAA